MNAQDAMLKFVFLHICIYNFHYRFGNCRYVLHDSFQLCYAFTAVSKCRQQINMYYMPVWIDVCSF